MVHLAEVSPNRVHPRWILSGVFSGRTTMRKATGMIDFGRLIQALWLFFVDAWPIALAFAFGFWSLNFAWGLVRRYVAQDDEACRVLGGADQARIVAEADRIRRQWGTAGQSPAPSAEVARWAVYTSGNPAHRSESDS
jgi:hypothetical protein